MPRRTLLALALALLALPVAATAADGDDGCLGLLPVTAEDLMLDPQAVPPIVGEACTGRIQPGASMHWCTLNWVFKDESGALYIGTAGHCAGQGARISTPGVGQFGTVAYSLNQGPGRDFALIRIDADKYHLVDPTLCRWGGPTKEPTYTSVHGLKWLGPNPQGALLHYGWGMWTNGAEATRARVGYASGLDTNSVLLSGNYNPGDSGSPVMFADGAAAGVVTHSFLVGGLGAGMGFATRLDTALAMAEAATGRDFALVTSDEPVLVPADFAPEAWES